METFATLMLVILLGLLTIALLMTALEREPKSLRALLYWLYLDFFVSTWRWLTRDVPEWVTGPAPEKQKRKNDD